MDVKAYDLRRNATVLRRIAEIEALELNTDNPIALAYKGLDIDGFIGTNRTPDKMKRSLAELDERWRKLYDYASNLSKRVSTLSDNLQKSETLAGDYKNRNAELSTQMDVEHKLIAGLKAENTYLRKMIREYLYPALADSILKSEFAAFGANQAAIDAMTDGDVPASFSKSVAADRALRSSEDNLIEMLRLQAMEGDCDAP
jgi:hypothetical protein